MKPIVGRLVLVAAIFIAWIGWLGFLAVTTGRPVVLSRPQLLVSQLDVVATLTEVEGKPAPTVEIEEVLWPLGNDELLGKRVIVVNLPSVTAEEGWKTEGKYILPLVKDGDEYRVAAIPASPGFRRERPRIYPDSLEAREDLVNLRQRSGE